MCHKSCEIKGKCTKKKLGKFNFYTPINNREITMAMYPI